MEVKWIDGYSTFECESIGNCMIDSGAVDSKKLICDAVALLHFSRNISAERASAITNDIDEIISRLMLYNGFFDMFRFTPGFEVCFYSS